VAAVRTNLQDTRSFVETVVAPERHSAAILSRARLVGDELVCEERDRMLRLGDLDRLRGHVRENVRIAVEAIGPGTAAPCAAREIDVYERLAVRVVSA